MAIGVQALLGENAGKDNGLTTPDLVGEPLTLGRVMR